MTRKTGITDDLQDAHQSLMATRMQSEYAPCFRSIRREARSLLLWNVGVEQRLMHVFVFLGQPIGRTSHLEKTF